MLVLLKVQQFQLLYLHLHAIDLAVGLAHYFLHSRLGSAVQCALHAWVLLCFSCDVCAVFLKPQLHLDIFEIFAHFADFVVEVQDFCVCLLTLLVESFVHFCLEVIQLG